MDHNLTSKELNEIVVAALALACERDEVRKLRNMLRDFFGKELKDLVMQASKDQGYTIDSPELQEAVAKTLAVTCSVYGSVECLTLLLQKLPGVFDLNRPDDTGTPCLHHAVIGHHVEAVAFLIQSGAAVDSRDVKQRCPLHLAVAYQQRDVVLLLLAKKASLECQDTVGATALHYAVQMCGSADADRDAGIAILLCLLRAKANVDCKDNRGRTPLHWAAVAGNAEVCRVMSSYGASSGLTDNSGQAAIHLAAKTAFTEVLSTLVRDCNADVNLRDASKQSALLMAAAAGQLNNVKALLDLGAKDSSDSTGKSAAHAAAAQGDLRLLEALQASGHNLWRGNGRGELPIHFATTAKKNDVVYHLLQHEKCSNPRGQIMRSCFHLAASSGNIELMAHLLKLGVSVNAAMKYQNGYLLPLDIAEQKSQLEASTFLRQHGAMSSNVVIPKSVAIVQRTVRRVAQKTKKVKDAIVRQPTYMDDVPDVRPFLGLLYRRLQVLREQSPVVQQNIFDQLLQHERHSNPRGPALKSCLHMAAGSGNVYLMSSLIKSGVSVNAIVQYEGKYKTPLDVSEERGQREAADFIRQNGGRQADSVVSDSVIALQRTFRRFLQWQKEEVSCRSEEDGRTSHETSIGDGRAIRHGVSIRENCEDDAEDEDYQENKKAVKPYLSLVYRRVDDLRRIPAQ